MYAPFISLSLSIRSYHFAYFPVANRVFQLSTMQTLIRDSFGYKLPNLPSKSPGKDYRKVSPSASTTAIEEPPIVYMRESASDLANIARHKLRQLQSLDLHSPALEETHFLAVEADVVRASGLELIHPINIVLPKLAPSANVRCNSEVTDRSNHSRFDMKWYFADTMTTFAILEFKNTKVLNWEGFESAACDNEDDAESKLLKARGETLLDGNAIVVSKQAKKYARTCKDVAIFDWNCMMVYDFSDVDEDASPPKPTRGIFFDEGTPANGQTFRLVLLGFLIRAINRHGRLS